MVRDSPSLIRRLDATGIPLLLARLGVGGMFAYLAYMKLRDPINFLKLTHEYGLLPPGQPIFLNLTAVALPWLEMVCAVALLLGVGRRGAALLITGMLLFFTPMLFLRAWNLHTAVGSAFPTFCAVKFDCGCGTGEVFICPKLAENVALLIGALIALFSASRRFCLANLFTRRRAAAPAQPVPQRA
jgi:uncharacterized membrane protein YphA (DoxX/SURF4 family)